MHIITIQDGVPLSGKFPEAKIAEMNEETTPLNTKNVDKIWLSCF